jgi:acyl carrier protein
MDEAALIARVTSVFHDVFDDDSIVLNDAMTARDVDGWDSVANVRLMISVEEAFGIRFDMQEISELRNVGELLAAVRKRVG